MRAVNGDVCAGLRVCNAATLRSRFLWLVLLFLLGLGHEMAAAMDLSAPTHAFSSPASSVDKMARRRQLVAEREQLEREQALRLAKTAGSSGSAGIPSLPASGPGAGDGAGVSGAGAGSALSSAHVPVHGQHVAQVDGSVVLSPRDPSRPRDPLPSQVLLLPSCLVTSFRISSRNRKLVTRPGLCCVQVTEAIYLSGKEPASDARWLSEHNVGGIINLCHADGVENAFERRHDQEGEAEADAEGSGVCGWRQDCGARPRQHRQGHTPEARTDRCAITGGGGSTVVATAAAGSGHHSAISHDVTASAGDTKSIDKGNGHGSTAMTASDRESDTDGRRSAEHSQIGQNGLAKGLQLQYLTLDVYDADSLGAHSDISQVRLSVCLCCFCFLSVRFLVLVAALLSLSLR